MRYGRLLKLVTGLAILAILFWKFDLGKIAGDLVKSDPLYILIAFAITPVTMYLRALRLQRLLLMHDEKVSTNVLNELGYIGFLLGLVTPSRAGEFVRAYYLTKDHKVPYSHSLGSIFIDRVLDVITLFVLVNLALIYFPYAYGKDVLRDFTWIIPLATLLFIALLYLLTKEWFLKKAIDFTENAFCKVLKKDPFFKGNGEASKEFHVTLQNLKNKRKEYIPIFLVNAVLWFFVLLQAWVILKALGEDAGLLFTFLAVPFAILASLLPITVSGIGTRDVAMVALFSLAGVPASKALSMSLLYLAIGQVFPAFIGEYLYMKGGYGKGKRWQGQSKLT